MASAMKPRRRRSAIRGGGLHFRPPANWMSDPTDFIQVGGYYPLFYQAQSIWRRPRFDPLGTRPQPRPRPLGTHADRTVAVQGTPRRSRSFRLLHDQRHRQMMIFYTSAGPRRPTVDRRSRRCCHGEWIKPNPQSRLTQKLHPSGSIDDWRDPFVFDDAGGSTLILGGNLNGGEGGKAIVALYERKTTD